ncbi:fibronectin type III domain-containing protein [Paenibacillus sp. S02]|uniref:fibronectin type III domain-containing protein n=1 Tax=Paenibacillus sp. S02 TaxID=2823904 RepID=UPI001C64FC64|nr:fibronectin type III domain-containing protein [Paenibacillus sp. S02]QYK68233.1 hypothetical protein KAI36_03384 [Paenibacillus sp. S02]
MNQMSKKIKLLFGALVFVFFALTSTTIYAASVGGSLTSPENGWKRYDDSSPKIKYEGIWLDESNTAFLNGKSKYSKFNNTDSKLVFKFKGTKLRIIGPTNVNKPTEIPITIDNVTETFSGYSSNLVYGQILLYEKTGLSDTVHTVTIETPPIVAKIQNGDIQFDAIDIDENGQLIDMNVPINLKATPGDSQVTLKWDQTKDAESYTVKYGTESGKYTESATATKDAYGNFIIPGLTNGTKYYFVVSAKANGVDSEYSNEASATPQGGGGQPDPEPTTGDRAILVVTMTTGLEKEFDLSMKEVNDFIAWYEGKQAGSGSASYAINKHDNNKGPFSSRKDYMLYDRILTFEVSEYSK